MYVFMCVDMYEYECTMMNVCVCCCVLLHVHEWSCVNVCSNAYLCV